VKALILVADGFEDCEVLYPYYRLREEGVEVDVAGPAKKTYTGKHGYDVTAGRARAELAAGDYDLLVVPGGKAPEAIRLEGPAIELVRTMMEAGKVIAAICHGAQVLISAKVLSMRKATCWKGIRDDLVAAGCEYQDHEVVVDHNLVTSRCPDDLPAFCREMLKALWAAEGPRIDAGQCGYPCSARQGGP
jgi:protease I